MSKKVLVRLAFSDVTMSKEDADKLASYANVVDKEGEYVTDTEIYAVGWEDEDGEECNEDGSKL